MSELREQLRAAMRGEDGGGEPAAQPPEPPVTGDAGAEAVAAAAEPAQTPPEPKPEEAGEKGPERDEHGRFKARTDKEPGEGAQAATPEPPTEPEPAKPEEKGPEDQATRIPPSLSAAVKSQWKELPQTVRDEFSRLEDSFQKGKAEWGKKAERLNRYDEIIGPHVDRWRMAGLDEFSGVQTLLAAQNVLERNPVEGIVHIARSYGVTPAHLAQAFGLSQTSGPQPGAEGQQAPTLPPDFQAALQPLMQTVQTLQQQLSERDQRSEAEKLAEAQRTVEAFASDPANMYFDNVREDVARLIQIGAAKGLKEAYDMAIWASPEIRPLLLKAQAEEAQRTAASAQADAARKAEEQKRAKAQAAQQAGGSVTGAPAPGAKPPEAPHGNLRETLRAAMREHAQQV